MDSSSFRQSTPNWGQKWSHQASALMNTVSCVAFELWRILKRTIPCEAWIQGRTAGVIDWRKPMIMSVMLKELKVPRLASLRSTCCKRVTHSTLPCANHQIFQKSKWLLDIVWKGSNMRLASPGLDNVDEGRHTRVKPHVHVEACG
jgi:hypothetical protein